MVYDGAVSAIKHGAVFASVGTTVTGLVIALMMPFIAYTILKTAAVAAKNVIMKTVIICKKTTSTIINTQTSICKKVVSTVKTLTANSLIVVKLLLKNIMTTMKKMVGFGKFYMKACLNVALKFKDLAIEFVKRGFQLVRKTLRFSINTIIKFGEIVMKFITETPEKLYKLLEVIMTKIFPGMVKIMTVFPVKFYNFIYKWLPEYMRFVFYMCREAVRFDFAVTSMMINFHLVAAGIQFVGRFFKTGKTFRGDFVKGIDSLLNVIPSFADSLDADSIQPIPDKIINYIIYDLNFQTGMNDLMNAKTTTLPLIDAKESEISAAAFDLNTYESEKKALMKQIEISPDPNKSLEISRLQVIIDGLETQLDVLKGELSSLELNRKFTFDELLLRTLFCNISLFKVYTVPPPIPPLLKILVDFLFNTNITPSLTVDVGFSDSWGFDEFASVSINVSASFTIRAIKIADFYPDAASAVSSFANWLDGRLRSEDAYETIDGKKKSKLRAITRNPAAFVKFVLKIIVKWMEYFFDSLGINLENFISVAFSATTDLDTFIPDELEDVIDISEPPLGDILQFFTGFTDGAAWVFSRAINYVISLYGSLMGYFTTEILRYTKDVIFASLNSTYPSDDFNWL